MSCLSPSFSTTTHQPCASPTLYYCGFYFLSSATHVYFLTYFHSTCLFLSLPSVSSPPLSTTSSNTNTLSSSSFCTFPSPFLLHLYTFPPSLTGLTPPSLISLYTLPFTFLITPLCVLGNPRPPIQTFLSECLSAKLNPKVDPSSKCVWKVRNIHQILLSLAFKNYSMEKH